MTTPLKYPEIYDEIRRCPNEMPASIAKRIFDALSEGAQAGDRGQAMDSAINNMEDAITGLDNLISALNDLNVEYILDVLAAASE